MQTLSHHRMYAAIEPVFGVGVIRRTIGELLHGAGLPIWTSDGDEDAVNGPNEAGLLEQGADFPLSSFRIAKGLGMPGVQIDDNFAIGRYLGNQRIQCPGGF